MRLLHLVCFASTLACANSQFFIPSFLKSRSHPDQRPLSETPAMANDIPGVVLPPSLEGEQQSSVIISDVISHEKSINVFAGLSRDIQSVSKRLDDQSLNTTVLAPLNSVITSLPRKPWEDPRDYGHSGVNAYAGKGGEDKARQNLQRFAEAHLVTASPWEEGKKIKNMIGLELWWENKDGKKIIQPGNIEVSSVAEKVANGQIWIIKGVVNYA